MPVFCRFHDCLLLEFALCTRRTDSLAQQVLTAAAKLRGQVRVRAIGQVTTPGAQAAVHGVKRVLLTDEGLEICQPEVSPRAFLYIIFFLSMPSLALPQPPPPPPIMKAQPIRTLARTSPALSA